MPRPRVLVLAPHGRDAAVIADVLAGIGAEAAPCADLATLAVALADGVSAVVATEEDLAGPALGALLTWVAGQANWSDLPFLILGGRATRSAAQSALLQALGNAVLLERPLAAEALATAARAALRARGRQFQVREEVLAREEAAQMLRELNRELERRVEARTAELRANEARFRAYFDAFPESLFVVGVAEDAATGDVAFAYEGFNPEAERVTGLRSADVAGKPPSAFLPAPAGDRAEAEFRRCLALGGAHAYTQRIKRGSETLTFDVVVTPMRDPRTGQVARLLGVARDVTQQRLVEERLRQAQKLEALGQLTGGVAHDFNNLLQVITSGLTLLERAGAQDERRRAKLVQSMRHAAGRGAELVRRLLAFARRQPLHPEAIALGPWLDAHVRDLLSRALRGDIVVRRRVAADLPPVRADAAELELALLNLALNARDAMPQGGELLIEADLAGPRTRHDAGELAGRPEGVFVRLSVTDTGTGMPPEVVGRLFEPFFTTKEPGQGAGLGLAQVYGFTRQSGGAVQVRTEPGRGTTFSLLLPVADGLAPAASPDVTSAPPVAKRSLDVLVCEDDDAVASLVCQLLDQLGHRERRVAHAAAALAALDGGAPVDLLLTDIIMPGGMDGAVLAREAKRRHPNLAVLLMTGYQGRAEAEGLPMLRKPYSLDDLAAAIAQATGGTKAPIDPPPRALQNAAAEPNSSRSPA